MGLCSPCMAISSSLPTYPRDPASEPTFLRCSVQNLVQQLNNLPGYCLPRWLVHPTDQEVRVAGRSVRHQDDHGNCAASALLLVMLRPQMFAAGCCGLHPQQPVEWPPLRIFGVPPPDKLLTWDYAPRSGQGSDNYRGNIMEGINEHLRSLEEVSPAATSARQNLQDTWIIFRTRVEMAAGALGLMSPIPAVCIARASLEVPDVTVLR